MSRCDLAAYITKPSLPASWVSTYTGLRKCSLDDCALAGTAARPADASTAAAESRRRDLRIAVPSERVGTRFDEAGAIPAATSRLRYPPDHDHDVLAACRGRGDTEVAVSGQRSGEQFYREGRVGLFDFLDADAH